MKDHECDCSLSCCITMYSPVPWLQWHYTFLYRTWLHASSRVKTSRLMLAPCRHPYLTPISSPFHHLLPSTPDIAHLLHFPLALSPPLFLVDHCLTRTSPAPPLSLLVSIWYQRRPPVCREPVRPIYSRSRGVYNSVESCGSCTFLRRVQLTVGGPLCWATAHSENWPPTFLG